MCLIGVSFGVSGEYPLIVAANRDELHSRPTDAAHWWADAPDILAGRDQLARGTWLGVDRGGSICAVTNLRDARAGNRPKSRGNLVADFLASARTPSAYAESVIDRRNEFKPFNLLLSRGTELRYVNSEGASLELSPGVHAISNTPIGDDWTKTARIRAQLARAVEQRDPARYLLDFLSEQPAGSVTRDFTDDVFVRGDTFGTRSSTVILVSKDGWLELVERQYDSAGQTSSEKRFVEQLVAAVSSKPSALSDE